MTNPTISVIIPVYNGEEAISKSLEAILCQSFNEFEIICVNDGSRDSTADIIQNYSDKDKRIILINKENEGQGYARKIALSQAQGKYILFCDHDDVFCDKEAFSKIYKRMEDTQAELLFFDFRIVFPAKHSISAPNDYFPDKIIFTHEDIGEGLLNRYFAPWFKAYRKDFLDRYDDWYMPKKMFLDDPPFHVQAIIRAKTITHLNAELYEHRCSTTSVTGRKKTLRHIEDCCNFLPAIKNILEQENLYNRYIKEFIFLLITHVMMYLEVAGHRQIYYEKFQELLCALKPSIQEQIASYPLQMQAPYPYLNREQIFFYKIMTRLSSEDLETYRRKKEIKPLKKENTLLLKQEKKFKKLQIDYRSLADTIIEKEQMISNLQASLTESQKLLSDSKQDNVALTVANNALLNSISFKLGRSITRLFDMPYALIKKIRTVEPK